MALITLMRERYRGYGSREFQTFQEPKTFRYFREVSADEVFKDIDMPAQMEALLKSVDGLNEVGPILVRVFGTKITKTLALKIRGRAEADLRKDPTDRPAKNAVRWTKRAKDRITEGGRWVDPGLDRPQWADPIPRDWHDDLWPPEDSTEERHSFYKGVGYSI